MERAIHRTLALGATIAALAACDNDFSTAPSDPVHDPVGACELTTPQPSVTADGPSFLIAPCEPGDAFPDIAPVGSVVEVAPVAPVATAPTAAVASAASASGAVREVQEWVTDFTGGDVIRPLYCGGELIEEIRMDGIIRHRLTVIETPAGGFHSRLRENSIGLRATGLSSGDEYRIIDKLHAVSNYSQKSMTDTFRTAARFVGTKSGRQFSFVQHWQFTIAADGKVAVDRLELRYECKS